jgi:hypothetical protein
MSAEATLAQREQRVRELEAQLAGLVEFNVSARRGEPWQANAQFKGEAIKAWAIGMVDCFTGEGATNYLTCELIDPRTSQRYEITMQKCGGKTPAQALSEAAATIAALRSGAAQASDQAGGDTPAAHNHGIKS